MSPRSRRHFLGAAGLASLAIPLLLPPTLRSETAPPHPADDPAAPPFPTTSLVDRYVRAFQLLAAGYDELGISAFNNALAESETAGLPAIAVDRIRQLVALTDAANLHDRLLGLHISRGGLEWLPESDRVALLDQIDTAYRRGLLRAGSSGQEARARSYLLALQEIRDSVRFCGVHWPHPRKEYANGTPFVERVMCFAGDQEEFHREAVRVRIQRLRDTYPTSPIILRIDYRPSIAIPRDDAERDEYYPRLAEIMSAPEFEGIIIQQGNEPQLEGSPTPEVLAREFNGWGTPPEDTRNFWMTAAIHNPNAPRLPPAIATFNPDGPEEPNPAGIEDSPWARLAYRTKSLIVGVGRERDRLPHAWSEHVYGDPITSGSSLEPWDEPRDSHGYRWQTNVADTWHEVNRAVEIEHGIAPMDVWVTEYNTAARGVEGVNAPEASYTCGWMFNAIARMAVSLPTLRGACWFVGDAEAHNNSWVTFALHERRGQLANAEDDFYDLLDAGF